MRAICGAITNKVETQAETKKKLALKEVFTKFALGSIVTCTFGVNSFPLADEESVILKNANKLVGDILKLFGTFIPGVGKDV